MKQLQFILSDGVNFPIELNFSPDGWNESIINRTRNDNYFSVSEKFTTQLTFVEDGAAYLKNIFYTKGIDGFCKLTITQLNDTTLQYVTIYQGNIDFSTFVDGRFQVKVNINEGSFWETIKAKEKTDYEIDIDSLSPITIDADFPALEEKINAINSSQNITLHGLCILGFSNLVYENSLNSISYYDNQTASNVALPYSQPTYLVEKPVTNASIYFYGDLALSAQNTNTALKIKLLVSVYNGVTNTFYSIQDFLIPAFNNLTPINFVLSSSIPITLNVGDFISINTLLTNTSGVPVTSVDYYLSGDIYHDLTYSAYPLPKQIKALRASTVFNELLKRMNDDVAMAYNQTFFNQIYDYVITSGDAIRGLTGAKIKTNFADFFNSFNTFFGCGFGYENNKAWMDFKSHFFQNVEIKNFGEVSDFELSVFKNWTFNAVKIGYDEQTYDDVNGRFEFNQSQDWTLPIKKIAKKQDMISNYRADLFGIIFTSLNLEGKTTTDSDNDNDVFVIHTKTKFGAVSFNRYYNTASVQGFSDVQKLFNYKLSPKRCLLRNSDFFNSFLHLNTGDTTFTSGLKNTDLQVQALDEVAPIKESTKLLYTELKNPLYLPYQFQFKAIITKDFNQFINSNQNGYVKFTYKGIELKGFIYEVGVNPSQNTEYQLKLIAHPDCDLTQII
jgi:hypothetical protein